MKVIININNQKIEFSRNWITGNFKYTLKGKTKILDSAFNPFTHYSLKTQRIYEVKIENSLIKIIKTRPLFLAGLKPHKYEFYVDNDFLKEVESY